MKRIHISSASVTLTDAEREALTDAVAKLPKGEHSINAAGSTFTGRLHVTGPNREFMVAARAKAAPAAKAAPVKKAAPKKAAPKKASAKK